MRQKDDERRNGTKDSQQIQSLEPRYDPARSAMPVHDRHTITLERGLRAGDLDAAVSHPRPGSAGSNDQTLLPDANLTISR